MNLVPTLKGQKQKILSTLLIIMKNGNFFYQNQFLIKSISFFIRFKNEQYYLFLTMVTIFLHISHAKLCQPL